MNTKTLTEFLNQQSAETMVVEMAKINLKEDGTSLFPANKYRIWVQGDNSPHKEPHLHIKCNEEGWELKIYIATGEIWEVVCSGKRRNKSPETFSDVVKNMKEWFTLQTTMPGRVGTNQETAQNEWDACNA